MSVRVTPHAKQRVKERVGLSKELSEYVAEKALANGLRHCDVAGSLKRYLDKIYLSHKNASNMRIYNHKVFIFCGEKLITVLNLPQKYFNTVNKINKIKYKGE